MIIAVKNDLLFNSRNVSSYVASEHVRLIKKYYGYQK